MIAPRAWTAVVVCSCVGIGAIGGCAAGLEHGLGLLLSLTACALDGAYLGMWLGCAMLAALGLPWDLPTKEDWGWRR